MPSTPPRLVVISIPPARPPAPAPPAGFPPTWTDFARSRERALRALGRRPRHLRSVSGETNRPRP